MKFLRDCSSYTDWPAFSRRESSLDAMLGQMQGILDQTYGDDGLKDIAKRCARHMLRWRHTLRITREALEEDAPEDNHHPLRVRIEEALEHVQAFLDIMERRGVEPREYAPKPRRHAVEHFHEKERDLVSLLDGMSGVLPDLAEMTVKRFPAMDAAERDKLTAAAEAVSQLRDDGKQGKYHNPLWDAQLRKLYTEGVIAADRLLNTAEKLCEQAGTTLTPGQEAVRDDIREAAQILSALDTRQRNSEIYRIAAEGVSGRHHR